MKIQKLLTYKLRNDAHFQFHQEFIDLVNRIGPEALKINAMFQAYIAIFRRLDAALKKINKSAITRRIQAADRDRDETYEGLFAANKAALKHYDPAVKESARELDIVFNTYGNIANKPYNEETSAIYNILQDLISSKYAPHVARVGLGGWVTELQQRNSAFDNLMKERYDEAITKCEIVVKEVRIELDNAYFAIREFINALVIVEGEADYEVFVKTLNAIIAKFTLATKGRRHGLNPETNDSPDLQDGETDDGSEELEQNS